MPVNLTRRVVAEALGTAFLLAAVVGSGIMGERLAGGNDALALLANTAATVAALAALILTFGPLSGAHFNPAVTIVMALRRDLAWSDVLFYLAAQLLGAVAGVFIAHLMFSEPLVMVSAKAHDGMPQAFSEFIATFGLIATIWSCSRSRSEALPYAVAAYIGAAYWFTASTSFANPAVTIARALTDTFTGIAPRDVPAFILAEFAGALAAACVFRWLMASAPSKGEAAG